VIRPLFFACPAIGQLPVSNIQFQPYYCASQQEKFWHWNKIARNIHFQKIYPDSQGIVMSLRHRQLLAAAAAVLSLFASAAELKSVAITAIVDHPALDAARKGVTDELKAEGLGEDKVKVQYQSAQGNPATAGPDCPQVRRRQAGCRRGHCHAVGPGTGCCQQTLPIVFTAVTDPVAAKLVSRKSSGTNVTGVSDMLPLGPQVDLILKVKPVPSASAWYSARVKSTPPSW
jgi:hypothetical protein